MSSVGEMPQNRELSVKRAKPQMKNTLQAQAVAEFSEDHQKACNSELVRQNDPRYIACRGTEGVGDCGEER